MKKLILFFTFFLSITSFFAQNLNENESNLSPNGVLEKVFDHYGNSYNLSDIIIGKEVRDENNQILRSTNPTPMTCGYYNLYFEDGCGMEDISNSTHVERRDVVCQVLNDLSNFINTPLTTNGLNNKVNIWVRNINNVIESPDSPSGVLGLASSFYSMPYNTTTGFGGIVDNEIWKTIHLGKNSYTNVISPLVSNGISSGASGIFYHGMMAFNFNTTDTTITNNPAIYWNTNLSATSFSGLYDLYSVVLHEVTHALGFASLINSSGNSKFDNGYNYFTRYDTRLKNSGNTDFLIKKNTSACGNMYNFSFNNLLNSSILNSNNCTENIRFIGQSNVNVRTFTPPTFSDPSSLSHFNDTCNGLDFVMNNEVDTNVIKRFFSSEERNTLGDLGYNVNNVYNYCFGTSNQTATNYTGIVSGISVAGMNDGINTDGNFSYIGFATTSNPIILNSSTNSSIRILSNDTSNSTHFECLEDITDPNASISNTSGNGNTTDVTLNSTVSGLHLLRYVPTNSTGTQKGNITYIYVYVESANNCGTPTTCNLVINGHFEDFSSLSGSSYDNLSNVCSWSKGNLANPNYFNTNHNNAQNRVPCNLWGVQDDFEMSNNAYVGVVSLNHTFSLFNESIKTQLLSSLIPNTQYQLSFDVSLAEGFSSKKAKIQAYLSNSYTTYPTNGDINITNPNMLFQSSNYITKTDGWEKIIFNFTTDDLAGENTLYLGYLNNIDKTLNTASVQGINGCNYGNYNDPNNNNHGVYYFIDNVNLIPLNGTSFSLPENICQNESINNLTTYLDAIPFGGTFSGNGVSGNSFTALTVGINTITYTYTNSSGCSVSISDQIEVLASTNPLCDSGSSSCPPSRSFVDTEIATTPTTYSASGSIETSASYLVNSGQTIVLTAGNSITFLPNSTILSGASYLAKIEDCPPSDRISKRKVRKLKFQKLKINY